jgi:hypothetical protein
MAALLVTVTDEIVLGFTHEELKRLKPFRLLLGEELWGEFFAHQAMLGRMCLLAIRRVGDGGPWYRDDACLRLLREALPHEAATEVMRIPIARLHAVRTRFEADIALAVNKVYA